MEKTLDYNKNIPQIEWISDEYHIDKLEIFLSNYGVGVKHVIQFIRILFS